MVHSLIVLAPEPSPPKSASKSKKAATPSKAAKKKPATPAAHRDDEEDFQFDVLVGPADGSSQDELFGETVYLDDMPTLGGEEVIAEDDILGTDEDLMFDMELLQPPKKSKKKKDKGKKEKKARRSMRSDSSSPAIGSDTDLSEAETKTKKKAGTAKKRSSVSASHDESEPPVKRGRGRPRKSDVSLSSPGPRPSTSKAAKRKADLKEDAGSSSPARKQRRTEKSPDKSAHTRSAAAAAPAVDEEAYSAAQELIRLGEVDEAASYPAFPTSGNDVEVTGLVTDWSVNEIEIASEEPPPPKSPKRRRPQPVSRVEVDPSQLPAIPLSQHPDYRGRGRPPKHLAGYKAATTPKPKPKGSPKRPPLKPRPDVARASGASYSGIDQSPLVMHDNFVVELPRKLTNKKVIMLNFFHTTQLHI